MAKGDATAGQKAVLAAAKAGDTAKATELFGNLSGAERTAVLNAGLRRMTK